MGKSKRDRIKERLKKRAKRINKSYNHSVTLENSKAEFTPFFNGRAQPIQLLEELISPVLLATFFNEYWEKRPLVIHRESDGELGNHIRELFSLKELFTLLANEKLYYNQHIQICRYSNGKRTDFAGTEEQARLEDIRRFWSRKQATIQFHQPQHFKDNVWQLLTNLETVFGCLVGANVYLTPPNSQGLAPHYDDVEVFILQLEGSKHWRLYSPPILLPQDYSKDLLQDEIGLPTHDFILNAGDMVYFPRGTVHQADTPSDTFSTHITISTYQQHSWGYFLQHMVPLLLDKVTQTDVRYRAGLPVNTLELSNGYRQSEVVPLEKTCKKLASQLLDSVSTEVILQTREHFSLDFISSRLPPFCTNKEDIQSQGTPPKLTDMIKLVWPDYTYLHVHTRDGLICVYHSLNNSRSTHMFYTDQQQVATGIKFPAHFVSSLEELFSARSGLLVSSLPLSVEEKTQFVLSLWAEGLINVVD